MDSFHYRAERFVNMGCGNRSRLEPRDRDASIPPRKGFGFEVDKMPRDLYKTKTIELVVVIPESFVQAGLTNTFSSMMLLNDGLAVDIQTWPHEGQKRAIITISETMARASQLYFYYRNAGKGVTDGTQYVVKMRQVLEGLKSQKAQGRGANGNLPIRSETNETSSALGFRLWAFRYVK